MQPTEKDQPLSRRERFDEWFRNDTKNADKLFWGGIAAVVTSWWIGSNTWDFLTWGWDTFHDPSIEIVKRLELTIQLVLGFAGFLIFYATLVRAWAAERTAEAGIETARAATQQAAIAEKNLVAERFSKDLELLDNNKSVHSRVGALYDLGHIMRTHGDDYHHSIVDLISSYLRVESQVHAQDGGIQLPLPKIFARDTRDIYDPVTGVVQSMKGRGAPPISILRSDILAAINVLRTRPGRENEPTLLLAGAVLPQADLREANLSKADLRRSNCEQADMYAVNLTSANAEEANFSNASLIAANLDYTRFVNADLSGAVLMAASGHTVVMHGANLKHAVLHFSDFTNSDLRYADFTNADLDRTDLSDSDLSGAIGLTKPQLSKAKGNRYTAVAFDLRPDHWPPAEIPPHRAYDDYGDEEFS